MKKELEPSLLAFDLKKIDLQIREIKQLGLKSIHYDVMDNIFVPNTAFDTEWLDLIKSNNLSCSVHFMVKEPLNWIKRFVNYKNIYAITFHPEAVSKQEAKEILTFIKSHNVLAGVAIKPHTDHKKYEDLIELSDIITVMGVEPGFGGQGFIKETTMKNLKYVSELKKNKKLKLIVQLDGGVNLEVIKKTYKFVDNFVSGSFFMKQENKKEILKLINEI